MVIPNDTPVDLLLTSDAPMNSFWIPQLSGQIYAMPGNADTTPPGGKLGGNVPWVVSKYQRSRVLGDDFFDQLQIHACFREWIDATLRSPKTLDQQAYSVLARPTENAPISCFTDSDASLFSSIILRYMAPGSPSMNMAPGSS